MTSQRQAHGVQFTNCPECGVPTGQRGLAAHRQALHGIAPVTKGRKPKALTTAQASDLRRAVANGQIGTDSIAFGSLLKAGFVTESGEVTEAGRARLA